MAKKSMVLSADQHDALVAIYETLRIPSDQYRDRPVDRTMFLDLWNSFTSRNDPWEDVIHYIITKRKKKKWVRLGDDYQKRPDPVSELLTSVEWAHLETAYHTVCISEDLGSDNLMYDPDVACALALEFAHLSGRSVWSGLLIGLIMAKRKRGEWLTLRTHQSGGETDLGFSDIDDVA